MDDNPDHCRFARQAIATWNARASVECCESVEWLRQPGAPIDILYLDSMDTQCTGCAEHGLLEIEAAESRLHDGSIVVYDDSPWDGGWSGGEREASPIFSIEGGNCWPPAIKPSCRDSLPPSRSADSPRHDATTPLET